MTFCQRAFRYLVRKKAKTFILFLVLLAVNSMILTTVMSLRATEDAKKAIKEKTNSKIILEVADEKTVITDDDIESINALNGVAFVNRSATNSVSSTNFNPVTYSSSKEENNLKIMLRSYDDSEQDGAFAEQKYRLIKGNHINKEHKSGAIINSLLAELNDLEVGDTLNLETSNGDTTSVNIIGIFFAGSERRQDDSIVSIHRIENQIFIDNAAYLKLFGDTGYSKVSVYTSKPDQLNKLGSELQQLFSENIEMITSDTLYQQMKAPLEQIIRVTKLMFILTCITGTIVVSLLLCMWMRTRRRETAIFISMGESKVTILLQGFLESAIVFLIASLGACGLGSFMTKGLQNFLVSSQSAEIAFDISTQMSDVILLLVMGGFVMFIAVGSSLLPTLMSTPKNTLSKMEG